MAPAKLAPLQEPGKHIDQREELLRRRPLSAGILFISRLITQACLTNGVVSLSRSRHNARRRQWAATVRLTISLVKASGDTPCKMSAAILRRGESGGNTLLMA